MSEFLRFKFFDNEAALLITGDILMAAGGVVLGLLIELAQIRDYLIPVCITFFGLGGFFDYRSIRTFSTKLIQLKGNITNAQQQLDKTITQSKELETKLRETEKAISESEERMRKAEEKIFGSGGQTFSRSSWAQPIEKSIEELKREIKEIQTKLRDMGRSF